MSRSAGAEKWLVSPPVEHNVAIRMFCFPPAGSGAALYRLWPQKLPSDIAVYRIQPPGRETRYREQLLRDLATYEDALLEELKPLLEGPFAFFGHSMGSLIAFRLARRIRQELGLQPVHLFVSAFRIQFNHRP